MRQNGYSMDKIMSFINGYSCLVERADNYIFNISYGKVCNNYNNAILFNDYDEVLEILDGIIHNFTEKYTSLNEWERIGFKYAICLSKFYMKNVIFGDDTCVDNMYMNIPDKDDPESYDWESYGWDGLL